MSVDSKSYSCYFKASTDGFVYLTLGSRQNFNNSPLPHYVLVDNVKITVQKNSDIKTITFKNADNDKAVTVVPAGFTFDTQYGKPGDKVRLFGIKPANVNDFIEGFYNDSACNKKCNDYR